MWLCWHFMRFCHMSLESPIKTMLYQLWTCVDFLEEHALIICLFSLVYIKANFRIHEEQLIWCDGKNLNLETISTILYWPFNKQHYHLPRSESKVWWLSFLLPPVMANQSGQSIRFFSSVCKYICFSSSCVPLLRQPSFLTWTTESCL